MPGAGPRALAARAADRRWLTVLANTGERQAVAVPSLGLTAANFWQAGSAGGLTVSAPASVLLRERPAHAAQGRHGGRTASLCVAEPPRTGKPFEVVWDRPVRAVLAADPSVTVLAITPALRLRVTPGTACTTHTCTVAPR